MNDQLKALLEKHPYLAPGFALLEASDKAYHRNVEEQMALCKRVGEQIDSVHALVTVVEG